MNVATWSIRNPIPVVLAFVLLAIAGIRGFVQLPVKHLPEIDLPTVNVVLRQPGAAPAQLEVEVARRVEDAISNVAALRHLRTTIADGIVQVGAEFEIGKPLHEALSEVKEAVDRIRSDLPADVRQPAYSADVLGSDPVLTYALASRVWDESTLSCFIDDALGKKLLAVPGVSRVERVGGVDREVRVEVDPVRLAAVDVTVAELSRGLQHVQQDASGGIARMGGSEYASRTLGAVRRLDDLQDTPLPLGAGQHVYLRDVASVLDASQDRGQWALLDGRTVVGFNVYRTKGEDETILAEDVQRVVAALQAAHPGLEATVISGTVDYTVEQYRGSMQMLFEGALLAILVVWWFLGDWRATLVAAVALPLSILPAFALMPAFGFSLNTLTLLALAVVAGVLVDDAIVEIENIERHRRMGKTLQRATSDAVTEIALAVTATTLTLVVVFLPTALMPGIGGLLFRQFGWTAVIAVLASLLVARLLTPLLAIHWLKAAPAKAEHEASWMRIYLRAVDACLAHQRVTALMVLGFLAVSFVLVLRLPTGFIPASDRGFVQVGVELPPGESIEDSRRAVERVRAAVAGIDGISNVFAVAGERSGDQQVSEVRRSLVTLKLAPRGSRPAQVDIEKSISDRLATVPGARFSVDGGDGSRLSLILTGEDSGQLEATAQALAHQMRSLPGLNNVNSTAALDRPELIVSPDAARAAELGVSTAAIAETVRVALDGDFDETLARFNLENRQLFIRVRLADVDRASLASLGQLRVRSADGGTVPLESVASLSLAGGPHRIERYDRQRYVAISAGLGGMALGQAEAAVATLPASESMPAGVVLIEDGEGEMASELASGFATAAATGVLCMFCVLVLLFKQVLQPLTILSVVPVSLGGAFIALWATGSELDVPAMIGLVMLMGVVAKNSILLVDYAITLMRESGMDASFAVREACAKRARPIVMTTIAMVAGMLPIALGIGSDASFRQPMAIAVIGGLMISTYLSLFLVPVVFMAMHELHLRIGRRRFADANATP